MKVTRTTRFILLYWYRYTHSHKFFQCTNSWRKHLH